MSYLDVPRLHFFGRFYADPSTINNLPSNYDTSNPAPVWNPAGTHFFRFKDCAVSSVRDPDGSLLQLSSEDPIIGAPLLSAEDLGVAKLVDLDPDQQGVSAVFGHRISLQVDAATVLTGDMDIAEANGLWLVVVPTVGFSIGGQMEAAAHFQTTISIPASSWPAQTRSPNLDRLRSASDNVSGNILLSLKFVLDAFNSIPGPDFRTGRIVGTIGPGRAQEPAHCPARRSLTDRPRPLPSAPAAPWNFYLFNRAPFCVDESRRKLVLDLGNSIPVTTFGGSPPNIGALIAEIAPEGQPVATIGSVNYSGTAHNLCAGIVELDLTPAQVSLLQSNPLQLQATAINVGPPVILREPELDFAVEDRAFRMAFDVAEFRQKTTPVYVRRFGKPAAGVQLSLAMYVPGGAPLPDAANCIGFTIAPSDADGVAVLTLTALADPGQPADRQGSLDGQVYRIGVFPSPPDLPVMSHPAALTTSVRLFASFTPPVNPEWADVLAILEPYRPLYPGMFQLLDLTNQDAFTTASIQILQRLTAPFSSAGYMPVTRDLSPNKIETVVRFCRKPHVAAPRQIQPAGPGAQLPYTLSFKPVPAAASPLPALNSFASVVSPATGEWVVFGGLTGGAHSFTSKHYSRFIYVINPNTAEFHSFDLGQLPPSLATPLLCDNAQSAHDLVTNTGYIIGGFGVDSKGGHFITFDACTAFPIDALVDAIKRSQKSPYAQAKVTAVEPLLKQSFDPRFAVAGGGMANYDGAFFLMFGQQFKGSIADPVSPTSIQNYTEQIRHFRLDPATARIVDSSYGEIQDPGDHSFHRRDLNIVSTIDPDTGSGRIAAFGGVFQFGQMLPFFNPLYLESTSSAAVDSRFAQKMNLYTCPAIPAYDASSRTMSVTFFGGIAGWVLGTGQQLVQDANLPWSNQCTMVIQTPGGNYREVVVPDAMPGGRCLGADAIFHFLPSLKISGLLSPGGVLKLDAFPPNSQTLIGHIYGGIEAPSPDAPSEKTVASNRLFAVYLNNSPSTGIQVT